MTDEEAFEAEARKHGGFVLDRLDKSGVYSQIVTRLAWFMWQAATAHERERHRKQLTHQQASYEAEIKIEVEAERARCAKVCDAIAEDKWALYEGRKPYTGKEPGRASDFVQGQSDGADQCADAIRKGE